MTCTGSRDEERQESRQIDKPGSAQLDLYRFSGDSLQGRYHLLRLHPLSVAELDMVSAQDFAQFLRLGGFPEPFLAGSEVQARRWSREYRNLLVREEIASLERIQDLGNLELLVLRLPILVGSPLSVNSLREDLQLRHKTVGNWLAALERLYAVFRIPPLGGPRIRAIKKARKHYLKKRYPDCAAWQLTAVGDQDFLTPEGIRLTPALKFLATLV